MINLSNLSRGYRIERKRKGRGPGSGNGKTSGRGMKGNYSVSGGTVRIGLEGGGMPLFRKLPTRGFPANRFRKFTISATLREIDLFCESGEEFSPDTIPRGLPSRGRAGGLFRLKVIGGSAPISAEDEHLNSLKAKKVTIKAHNFSEQVLKALEAAGVKTEVLDFDKKPEANA